MNGELFVFRDALRLVTYFGNEYVIPKGNITALSKHQAALQIKHDMSPYPRFVVFWIGLFFRRSNFAILGQHLEAFDVR